MLFACGDKGIALKTEDGGSTWVSLNTATTSDLLAVDFINNTTGMIVGTDGVILYTTNAGRTWIRRRVEGALRPAFPCPISSTSAHRLLA
jgi:photosystem II stability/assembly factor-like uncharacterized protein